MQFGSFLQFYSMTRKLANEELNRKSIAEFQTSEKIPVIIILDDIRSMNNVGSVFRSADAFLVEKIILAGITPQPPHREIQKTALGATESVAWEYAGDVTEVIRSLKDKGVRIVAIEQVEESIMLGSFEPSQDEKWALVFGNEVFGVRQEVIDLADYCVEIPQFGTKHSLNISVSAGIVIWEIFQKLRLEEKTGQV